MFFRKTKISAIWIIRHFCSFNSGFDWRTSVCVYIVPFFLVMRKWVICQYHLTIFFQNRQNNFSIARIIIQVQKNAGKSKNITQSIDIASAISHNSIVEKCRIAHFYHTERKSHRTKGAKKQENQRNNNKTLYRLSRGFFSDRQRDSLRHKRKRNI